MKLTTRLLTHDYGLISIPSQPFYETHKDIFPLLTQPRQIVITTHQKPDADAMGSSLALTPFSYPVGTQRYRYFSHQLGRMGKLDAGY